MGELDYKYEIEYYDRKGLRITLEEFSKLCKDLDYKRVKQEHVGNYWISTVWLGMNHTWGSGAPLIFETMVFEGDNIAEETDMERYTTEEEALAGHELFVQKFEEFLWD